MKPSLENHNQVYPEVPALAKHVFKSQNGGDSDASHAVQFPFGFNLSRVHTLHISHASKRPNHTASSRLNISSSPRTCYRGRGPGIRENDLNLMINEKRKINTFRPSKNTTQTTSFFADSLCHHPWSLDWYFMICLCLHRALPQRQQRPA
jgi:hypothetical protein